MDTNKLCEVCHKRPIFTVGYKGKEICLYCWELVKHQPKNAE